MVGTMFKPFFKRFFGIFLCMMVVSTLAIGLLISFGSTIYNLKKTFKTYLSDYGDVDAFIEVPFTEKETLKDITDLDCVESVEYRLTMNAYLQKNNGRTLTSRIFTFKDDGSSLFDRYVLEKTTPSSDLINVSVVRKFALNNDFKLGDTFKMGYFGEYLEFYINEIIETPEAIQVRANNYVWSDNTDFGYVYLCESELDKTLDKLCELLLNKINTDEEFSQKYDETVEAMGDAFPDLIRKATSDNDFTKQYANQLLVKAAPGYTQEQTAHLVSKYLEGKNVTVKSATEIRNMFYYVYLDHAIDQVQVASIFLPLFFYAVTMIVIGLFVNQIIKAMTPEMGIMTSVGVDKKSIISIFVTFSLTMALCAGLLGSVVGVLLNRFLTTSMIRVYSIPTIPLVVNPLITALSVLSLLVIAEIATVISCQKIFNITPKDAMISNEAARTKLSPKLEAVIERAPMTLKLSLNSIAQNPRRFLVSVFSIFAAAVIILLSLFFYVSKTELMDQSVERRLSFDAQVYMTDKADDALIEDAKAQGCVTELLDCYYTYAEATTVDGGKRVYLECLAYDETSESKLVAIPNSKGKGALSLPKEGIILPKGTAKDLGVKKGQVIKIGGVPVRIAEISYQYFHPIAYLSKTQMEELEVEYVSSFLVDTDDEEAFLAYMSENNASLTVFTSSLSKDLHGIFNSIDPMLYILIAFSLLMGFVILVIMGQNALMEQKRQISILRAVGFTLWDISNFWTIQSLSQLVLSMIFALPVGSLVSVILFKMVSSPTQIYPFIFSWTSLLFTLGFILVIIVASHLLAMLTIKRWNLAENTRSRE